MRAAQRRFSVLGYDRTTTRDVAGDAGVNQSLIDRYFGGKDGLFQAVLATTPELLDETRPLRSDLAGEFLDSLDPDAFPEFGHHPLLLFVRDSGSAEEVQALRARAVRNTVDRIIHWSGIDAGKPGSAQRREVEIRAQMVQALLTGIVALRSMTPVEPLASADADELRSALEDAIDALMRPRHPDPDAVRA